MWISLFTIALAIALSLGVGAVMLESYEEHSNRGHRPVRSFRPVRMRN